MVQRQNVMKSRKQAEKIGKSRLQHLNRRKQQEINRQNKFYYQFELKGINGHFGKILFRIKKIKNNNMFQYNTFLFETTHFHDDFKAGASELPTTAHNSPGSMKSQSFKFEDSPFNCSFDEGSQTGHAQAIWEASLKYVQSAVREFTSSAKGLNDQSLYTSISGANQNVISETVEQMILKNTLLKIQQRHEFVRCFQNETELLDLMNQLKSLFNEQVFHEITYVIYKIWERKVFSEKQNRAQKQDEAIIQHFDCFWGYEEEEVTRVECSPFVDGLKSYEDVIQSADKCSDQLASELYFDNKLKFLNLRECKKQTSNDFDMASFFTEFFKSIARSVYLSSQGFFNQPCSNQPDRDNICCGQFQTMDSDFQFNQVSALQELQQSQNKFVRSFSQCLQDDEDDFEFVPTAPIKKRKLQ